MLGVVIHWLARSFAFFLITGLSGCIVIHSDSGPQEKPDSIKSTVVENKKNKWDCGVAAEKEVIELHEFFEAWYKGALTRSEESFSRLTNVLAEDFQLITATGFIANKTVLITLLSGGYKTKQNLNMRIANFETRAQDENLCLLTYEEHGESDGKPKQVLVTALLRRAPDKPNGLEWLHVHEVGVPVKVLENQTD